MPEYRTSEEGPDHAKSFTAEAVLGGVVYGRGAGRTKKDAEQQAAQEAWLAIDAAHRASDAPSA